jgi:hypothetical protein
MPGEAIPRRCLVAAQSSGAGSGWRPLVPVLAPDRSVSRSTWIAPGMWPLAYASRPADTWARSKRQSQINMFAPLFRSSCSWFAVMSGFMFKKVKFMIAWDGAQFISQNHGRRPRITPDKRQVSRRPAPVSLVKSLQGIQAARGRVEAGWATCCHRPPIRQQLMEGKKDFVDIAGSDPQLQKHHTVLPQAREACRSSCLTTQLLRL